MNRGGRGPPRGGPPGRFQESGSMSDERFGDRRPASRGQDARSGGSRNGQGLQSSSSSGSFSPMPSSPQIEKESSMRCEGFVVTMKEAYGFVQSADAEVQYFFHYSELRNGAVRDLRPGSELMFDVFEPRNGEKPTAVNVSLLPKGSIKLEVEIATNLRGLVHKEPRDRGSDRRDPRDKKEASLLMGRLKTIPEQKSNSGDPAPDSAVFGMEDTVNLPDGSTYKPKTEDEVLFDMVLVRATRQRRAVRVRLVKAKVDPRETGIVSTLKDSFGFIQCCDRDERLFFHYSEMLDRRDVPREGDEVEFTVEKDREGRNVGKSIKLLPPGTVSFVTILGERVQGTIERELRASNKKGGRGSGIMTREDTRGVKDMFGGLIGCEFEGQQLRLGFDGEDVVFNSAREESSTPLKGDQVELSICIHKPTKKKHATKVRVVGFGKEGREQGVVTKVKEGVSHAFIRCCEREEPLYFQLSELDGESATNGLEVEFNVVESRSDGRPLAVRLVRLPHGTVCFETILPGPFQGTILRSVPMTAGPGLRQPHGKKKGKENQLGLIVITSPLEHEPSKDKGVEGGEGKGRGKEDGVREVGHGRCHMDHVEHAAGRGEGADHASEVAYGWADLEDRALVLRKGDSVSFALHIDRPTKTRRAVKVALVAPASSAGASLEPATETGPEYGLVSMVKGAGGLVRCSDRDLRVYFSVSEVDPESIARARAADKPKVDGGASSGGAATSAGEEAHLDDDGRGGSLGHGGVEEEETEDHDDGHLGGARHEGDEEGAGVAHEGKETSGGGKGCGKVHVGDEVEMFIFTDPQTRRCLARRLRILPHGSVSFQAVVAEKVKGIVDKEATAGGKSGGGGSGSIRYMDGDGQWVVVPYALCDVEQGGGGASGVGRLGVSKGDAVELSVLADKASGERWAGKVWPMPHEGVIDSLKDSYGYIRPDRSDHDAASANKLVFFYLSDYWVVGSTRGKEPTAVRVKRVYRIKEGGDKMPDSLRRHHTVAKVVSRNAAGPDGTRGFYGGRGRGAALHQSPSVGTNGTLGGGGVAPVLMLGANKRLSMDALVAVAPEFTPGQYPSYAPAPAPSPAGAAQFSNADE